MNRTNIDWPGLTHTWNPVTGCRRGCSYCYARRIHERFNKTPFSEIVYHPDRINDVYSLKKPSKIFVGSMSDIEYWTLEQKLIVVDKCKHTPQHTFMFLSKKSSSYWDIDWPDNTMQGLTMTCEQSAVLQIAKSYAMIKYPRPFMSIEPLLGVLEADLGRFELVIVGAMTGPGAIPVKPEWIQSVKGHVPAEKLYFKGNLK